MTFIKEFKEGERITGQFLVASMSRGVNNSGAAYLSIDLRDMSGTINGKKWEVSEEDEKIFAIGNVVELTIDVIKYKESLQCKIYNAKVVPNEEVDIARFVKAPPIKKELLIDKFTSYVDSVENKDCKALLTYFISKYEDKLFSYPAASSIHHEYSSGLLMHITSMCDLAKLIASNYPNIDYDLLITGAILHDIGKLHELEGVAIYHYSLEGKLVGHISIMSAEIKKASEELHLTSEVGTLLQHMILSHHGQHEFGSPVLPLTSEALALSLIDNIDSKLVILNKAFDETVEGEFTNKIYPLDGRQFYKHKKI